MTLLQTANKLLKKYANDVEVINVSETPITKINRVLKFGDMNNEVEELHRLLNTRDGTSLSGNLFDKDTRKALINYQTKNNLRNTGMLDKETLNKLLTAKTRIVDSQGGGV